MLERWDNGRETLKLQRLPKFVSGSPCTTIFKISLSGAGNVKAIELFYRLFGLLIEKQEVEQTVTTTKDKSNDELQKELDELKKLLDESSSD